MFGGGDGLQSTAIGTGNDHANAVVQQSDGKLVAAGSAGSPNANVAVVRYNSDGSLDASFEGDGKLILDVLGGNDAANALAQQADGKLLVAGYAWLGSPSDIDFFLAR